MHMHDSYGLVPWCEISLVNLIVFVGNDNYYNVYVDVFSS
jgi:hypothetical protein